MFNTVSGRDSVPPIPLKTESLKTPENVFKLEIALNQFLFRTAMKKFSYTDGRVL